MNTPTEPVPPQSEHASGTGGTDAGMVRYSVPEAARLLGISERAVRKRITASTIQAHKDGTAWVVLLPATTGAVPRSELTELAVPGAAPQHGTGPDVGGTATGLDLSPLVSMIDRKDAEIRDLTNAAMSWQYRALRAEERLAALEAGPMAHDTHENASEDAQEASQRVESIQEASESLTHAYAPLRAQSEGNVFQRVWRAIAGG